MIHGQEEKYYSFHLYCGKSEAKYSTLKVNGEVRR